MPEFKRRAPWLMRPRQGAIPQRRPGLGQAMPRPSRAAGRGGFTRERGRRGATTPAGFARGRRGAATMLPELEARGGFTRDKSDTGGMKVKPAWARSGLSAIPVIGPLLGLFDWLRNLIFRGEEARVAKRQLVGPFGSKGRTVPIQGPDMTPQDMLDLTHGTGKFAQRGARQQGAARRGAGRRAPAMQGARGQRAFVGRRAARQRAMGKAA